MILLTLFLFASVIPIQAQCDVPSSGSYQKIGAKTGYFSADVQDYDYFGSCVSLAGDVDGDSVVDIVVGANGDDSGGDTKGAIYVLFLKTTGHVHSLQKISATSGLFTAQLDIYDYFGSAACDMTGLNTDAYVDIAVGAHGDDDGGSARGCVYILSLNSLGEVHSFAKISNLVESFTAELHDSENFGTSLANAGDLNGDGVTDLLVGSPNKNDGLTKAGALYILFLDTTGSVDFHQKISRNNGGFTGALYTNDYFGKSVCPIWDLDGDGWNDMVVGATGDDDGGTDIGAVYVIFTNYEFKAKSFQKISSTLGSFTGIVSGANSLGFANALVGDLNEDGNADIMTGSHGADDPSSNIGAVYILFLSASGSCLSHQKLGATAGPFSFDLTQSDSFGYSVSNLGDLNGDLIGDAVVGAILDSISGSSYTGSVYVVFGTGGNFCLFF